MTAAPACLFCGIAAKQVPATVVYEDTDVVAFRDLNPQAPVHVVVIPRQHVPRVSEATAPALGILVVAATQVAQQMQIAERGYRLVINCNAEGGQTVYHLHVHVLGGRPMRWPPG